MTVEAVPTSWDDGADLVIIGSGFAGLAAAIEAVGAGRQALVLEKERGCGGNSVISEGGIAAAGTRMQIAAGIADSPEAMYADMVRAGLGLNHPHLTRTVAEGAADAVHWTADTAGVVYLDRIDRMGGHSARRCYVPVGKSGADILRPMLNTARRVGVTIWTRCMVTGLVMDGDRRVRGVVVQDGRDGAVRRIRADRGVVLAAGGFGADVDFRSAQDPRLSGDVGTTNRGSAVAGALRLALSAGAMPVHLSWIQLGPWTSPDEKRYGVGADFACYTVFPYGIVVDPATGNRIVNEMGDRKQRADAILAVGRPPVGIADQRGLEAANWEIDRALKRGVVKRFDDLESLTSAYGVDRSGLMATVERFNAAVAAGDDSDFGKPFPPEAGPLASPPFYAMRLWPKVHYTMGGVGIDVRARVLDLWGRPIPGLFAAGEITGGVHGACRLGSCAITDCIVFGRIAGRAGE